MKVTNLSPIVLHRPTVQAIPLNRAALINYGFAGASPTLTSRLEVAIVQGRGTTSASLSRLFQMRNKQLNPDISVVNLPSTPSSGIHFSVNPLYKQQMQMALLPSPSRLLLASLESRRLFSTALIHPFSARNFSTASSTPEIKNHPDHTDLRSKNLSLVEMQQWLEKVKLNKSIGHISWGTLPSTEEAQQLREQIECHIIQNNKSYQPYPSDFIYGLLSAHAYEDAKIETKVEFQKPKKKDEKDYTLYHPCLAQWRVHFVHHFPDLGGYYGAVYENKQTRQLVLAHRGTTFALMDLFKEETHLNTDIKGILGGEIVRQHEAVYKVTQESVKYAKENHYHFSTTGHSLGAWLAEICIYFSEFEFNMPTRAVTFDSPGSITMPLDPNIKNNENKRAIEELDITTYLSDPNFVNTCNRHVGQVFRVYPNYEKYSTNRLIGTNLDWLLGVNLEGVRSNAGHPLGPILATFDPDSGKPYENKVNLMSRWPVIAYKTRDTVGSNILTKTLGTAGQNVQKSTIAQMINFLVDVCGLSLAQNLIPSSLSNAAIKAIQQSTMGNIAALGEDIVTGRLDQTQYLQCWEILSKPENIKTGKILEGDQFTLKYKGGYEAVDPLIGQLISRYQGDADWYLDKLHTCPPEKITQYFGQDSLITKQLSELQAMYNITPQHGHPQLIAHDTPIKEIRERLLRLLEVTEGKVAKFLQTHEQKSLEPSSLTLNSDLPSSLGNRYIFIKDDIAHIDTLLTTRHLIIHGEPGWGKTTLAIEYGHRQKVYPVVIQINADSKEKIDRGYRRIALASNISTEQQDAEKVILLINNRIRNQKEGILLIFDNVIAYEHIKPYLDYLPSNARVLITTRDRSLMVEIPLEIFCIKVKPFTRIQGKDYIENSCIKDRIQPGSQELQALLEHYAQGTDYIVPYYLEKAIAIIKALPTVNITTYLKNIKKYSDNKGELLLLIQQLTKKSKLAWPMLQYAAFLDPDSIDTQIFTQLFCINETELDKIIKALESLSVMYIDWKDGQPVLSLHRLTQGIVRNFIANPISNVDCMSSTGILLQLTKNLNTLSPEIDNNPGSDWLQAKKLISHIEHVLERLPEPLPDTFDKSLIAELLNKSGDYAKNVSCLFHKALHYYQKALVIRQQLYPNQLHPSVAMALENVGISYITLEGVENRIKGLALQEQALAMLQTFYGNKLHPTVAITLNNVGLSYAALGSIENHQKALVFLEQALTIRQALYKDQPHPAVATSLNNVGRAYQNLGGVENHQKALIFLEQALAIKQALYGKQPHLDMAVSLNNVAMLYVNLGGIENRKKGLASVEQALTMQQVLYGNQPHPNLAASLNNAGAFYTNLGGVENSRKGLALLEEALTMQRALFGDQAHPDIVGSLNNLGRFYAALGGIENCKKGLAFLEQALKMQQALYPNQAHIHTAGCLHNVGNSYVALSGVENIQKGLAFLEQALTMQQAHYKGKRHLDIANSLNNIGLLYANLGGVENSKKGLVLLEEALVMRQALFGDHPHPDLAASLNNVGKFYANLEGIENRKKGLAFLEQALAMQQALYPNQAHAQTAICLNNVGNFYVALCDVQKGLTFLEQALTMQQALYPNQAHAHTAICLSNVGISYAALGGAENVYKGSAFLEQALAMQQAIYGDQGHLDLATLLNKAGLFYAKLGGIENRKKSIVLIEQARAMQEKLAKR